MDARERAVQRAIRRQRVERRDLEPCDICGGAEVAVDDPTLSCTCDADRAEVMARAVQLAHEHLGDGADDSGRIVP